VSDTTITIDPAAAAYERHKERAAERVRQMSKKGRDIGPGLPPPDTINWVRRDDCRYNLRLFLETYLAPAFPLKWSKAHLKIIAKIEKAILTGGLSSIAAPRGFGKSTICKYAVLWAILYGHRRYVVLVAATQDDADNLLDAIKLQLQTNQLLLEDFPAAVYPVWALENESRRCATQLCDGTLTRIVWGQNEIVMPTIDRPDATCNGSVMSARGLTGKIRGQQKTTLDGEVIRPDIVLIDDPQTRDSAANPHQTQKRLRILMGDVLGLAGPGRSIAAFATVTVIYKDDLADILLDRQKHPGWQGERSRLMDSMPTATKLWQQYRDLRETSLREDGDGSEATEFYRQHQTEMDEGAEPTWPEWYDDGEISAVQHAMNLLYRDAESFQAEYQNDPIVSGGEERELLPVADILQRTNGHKRCGLPLGNRYLTAFIDVHKSLLYYCVTAVAEDFTTSIVDYGAWPDQGKAYYRLTEAAPTLQTLMPTAGIDGQVYHGLETLVDHLMQIGRYTEDSNTPRTIDRITIDSGWGETTNTVYQFCRQSRHRAILMPSKGIAIKAISKPLSEYRAERGAYLGHHWRSPNPKGSVRSLHIDVNYWKSRVFDALRIAKGDPGALTFWGDDGNTHRLFADHLHSEVCVQVTAYQRTVGEWKLKNNRPDNHLFDCLVGCLASASYCGAKVMTQPQAQAKSTSTKPQAPNQITTNPKPPPIKPRRNTWGNMRWR